MYLWIFYRSKGKPFRSINFFPSVNRSIKFPPVALKCLQILVWRTSISCRMFLGGLWVNVGTLPPSQNLCDNCDEAFQRVQKFCNLFCWLVPSLGSLLSENETSLSRKRTMQVNKSIYKVSWIRKVSLHPWYPLPPPLRKIRNWWKSQIPF